MLIGSFYFKLTSNLNLVGEYANNDKGSTHPQTECANRVSLLTITSSTPFVGDYITTWHDGTKKSSHLCDLEITCKSGSTSVFTITWRVHKNPSIIFVGEGMICDGILVGFYTTPKNKLTNINEVHDEGTLIGDESGTK
jgi:hypothetical protein